MLTDIRIAADDSQFGIPAAKLGIAYGYDGLRNLVSLVGPSWARLIMYTGMRIDSAEALRIGLVDRVVPDQRTVGRDHGDRHAPSPATRRSRSRPPRSPSRRC